MAGWARAFFAVMLRSLGLSLQARGFRPLKKKRQSSLFKCNPMPSIACKTVTQIHTERVRGTWGAVFIDHFV